MMHSCLILLINLEIHIFIDNIFLKCSLGGQIVKFKYCINENYRQQYYQCQYCVESHLLNQLTCSFKHSAMSFIFHFNVQPNSTQFQRKNKHGNRVMIIVNIMLLLIDLNYIFNNISEKYLFVQLNILKSFACRIYIEKIPKSFIRFSLPQTAHAYLHTYQYILHIPDILRSKIIVIN